MELPKVSIIVLNYNGLHHTLQCLNSLEEITYPNYDVIVVDNNSNNNEAKVIKSNFANYITVIENKENLGFAEANNKVIKDLLTENVDYIFLLNNDTIIIDKDFLLKMIRFMEAHPDVGVLGPMLLNSDGSLQKSFAFSSTIGSYFRFTMGLNNLFSIRFSAPIDVECVCGAAMLMRITAIKEVGLFDSSFFFYSEDHDWCYRAKKGGWRVGYFPFTSIIHTGGVTSGELKSLPQLYSAQLQFFKKHHYTVIGYFALRLFMLYGAILRTLVGLLLYFSSLCKNARFKEYYQSFWKLAIHLIKCD